MSEAAEVLRSYVRLIGRLSGAASVSLYVPPGPGGEPEILVHDGALGPLPELVDSGAAAEFHGRYGTEDVAPVSAGNGVASASADGLLYRIPLRWVNEPAPTIGGSERRKREARPHAELIAWIGLRFEADVSKRLAEASLRFPNASATLGDEAWWKGFLGVAAALAAHTRSLSRTLIDNVTGLPDRVELQLELENALARAEETGLPVVLLLFGPDDFGWVNERLDRRTGDLVLREIAAAVRGGLRSRDHVARYGGAIFAVILSNTPVDDGRMVADGLVRRLSDQRYYGGILRLEFSAGVAVADGQALDAHEMIRRADQALSAAKRGNAGSVRVWEKGSEVERAGSLDRLQGIFTGDKSKDYRNMKLLLESVAVIAASTDPAELARNFTDRLSETLHARRVGVFECGPREGLQLLGGLEQTEEGSARDFRVNPQDLAIVGQACRNADFVVQGGREPGELSLCAMPLVLQNRCLGGIVLEVPPINISFEGSDRKFLDALAAEMAVALDRARLIERERERQREERERLEAEVTDLRRVAHGSRLAYRSAAMESLLATARKVAHTDTTVLITGESGTGKELLANVLHELSPRRERPMVVVDCSAISPTLIESELFGHERGAFTGAHARKPGRLAQADGATVFLDEIGDLPLDLQSKLLRFVQAKQFTPVGSVVAQSVDVRILAATNVDLRTRVAEGKFREDLFHRLNVVRLHVPALRERQDDIPHLASIFLKQFAALYRRPAHHFTTRAEALLATYGWPGNVRELQNLVLTSVLFCDAPEVDVEHLQGFSAGADPTPLPSAPWPARAAQACVPPGPPDAAARLRNALAGAVAAALAAPRSAPPPLGKWLAEDLVLAADRLSGGVTRRGADLLGLPETTYRRQLRGAARRRDSGVAVRTPWWPSVADVLEGLVLTRPAGTDLCRWAEECLLHEIESVLANDPRTASALLGVTEPTLFRRKAHGSGHS